MQVTVHALIADYDADNYDYRTYWEHRAYEQWAEAFALRRLLAHVRGASWLIDLGGGFGRNIIHYRQQAKHAVLVDYSLDNLKRAASMYAGEIECGHLFLIRADLYHLPFIDRAFDIGLIVRVLHHLTEVEDALREMGRVIDSRWLLDVPIKHHVFAHLRALLHGGSVALSTDEPKLIGDGERSFANFHLAQVKRLLSEYGWDSRVAASVNNFRRWDQLPSETVIALLKPVIYGLEIVMQQVGKGWWGPSQFVRATRREPARQPSLSPSPALCDTPWEMLAAKMHCPICRVPLHWLSDAARCENCSRLYLQIGPIWDFVP